jgi:hypothetical protein
MCLCGSRRPQMASSIQPHPNASIRSEQSSGDLRITLLPLPWRARCRALAFSIFATVFFAVWIAIVLANFQGIWKTSPVTAILFASIGTAFILLMAWWLVLTVQSTCFCSAITQAKDKLTIKRFASTEREWCIEALTAFDAENCFLYLCHQGQWKHIAFSGRPSDEIRWIADVLADNWQLPNIEPFAENEVAVQFQVLDPGENDAEIRAGRLCAEPGQITLRPVASRAERFQFVSAENLPWYLRLMPAWFGFVRLHGPMLSLTRDQIVIDDIDPKCMRVTFAVPGNEERINVFCDNPLALQSVVRVFWSE